MQGVAAGEIVPSDCSVRVPDRRQTAAAERSQRLPATRSRPRPPAGDDFGGLAAILLDFLTPPNRPHGRLVPHVTGTGNHQRQGGQRSGGGEQHPDLHQPDEQERKYLCRDAQARRTHAGFGPGPRRTGPAGVRARARGDHLQAARELLQRGDVRVPGRVDGAVPVRRQAGHRASPRTCRCSRASSSPRSPRCRTWC